MEQPISARQGGLKRESYQPGESEMGLARTVSQMDMIAWRSPTAEVCTLFPRCGALRAQAPSEHSAFCFGRLCPRPADAIVVDFLAVLFLC